MTIYVIEASETNDTIPGLSFSRPVEMTQRDVSIAAGMEYNAMGWPRWVCMNDDERDGWDRAQMIKEIYA